MGPISGNTMTTVSTAGSGAGVLNYGGYHDAYGCLPSALPALSVNLQCHQDC